MSKDRIKYFIIVCPHAPHSPVSPNYRHTISFLITYSVLVSGMPGWFMCVEGAGQSVQEVNEGQQQTQQSANSSRWS